MASQIVPADLRLFTIFILTTVLVGAVRKRRPALLRQRPILASEIVLQPFIKTLARRCTLNASLQIERRPFGIFRSTSEVSLRIWSRWQCAGSWSKGITPVPAVSYTAQACVKECIAPQPVVTYTAPALVDGCIAPAPAVSYAAPCSSHRVCGAPPRRACWCALSRRSCTALRSFCYRAAVYSSKFRQGEDLRVS